MPDYDNERPSKRQRRDSSPASPSKIDPRNKRGHEKPYRSRSPQDSDLEARHSTSHRGGNNRQQRRRSRNHGGDYEDEYIAKRIDRSRSREDARRDRHNDSYRDRNRSFSPRAERDRDRDRNRHRDMDRDRGQDSGSRGLHKRNHHRSRSPRPFERAKAPLPSQVDVFTSIRNPDSALEKPIEKQKPNFGLTGKLAAASNTIQTANQTIVLKYHEPPEARKPSARDQWRLYVFKGDEILDTVELAEQSCWLIGREVAVADFPIEHASCSKQHAVIQFRYLEKRNEFGDKIGKVKPYVIDLESANGTTLNEEPIPMAKYVELKDKDVLRFGHSNREYVIQLPK